MEGEGSKKVLKIFKCARGVLWVRPYFSICCPVSISVWTQVHFSVEQGCLGDADGSLGSPSGSHPLGCWGVLDVTSVIGPRVTGPKIPVLREDTE